MTVQLAWGFGRGELGRELFCSKARGSNSSTLCSTIFQTQECQGSWPWRWGCRKGLNPAFKGDWGETLDTPTWAAGLFFCQVRAEVAASWLLSVVLPIYLN